MNGQKLIKYCFVRLIHNLAYMMKKTINYYYFSVIFQSGTSQKA